MPLASKHPRQLHPVEDIREDRASGTGSNPLELSMSSHEQETAPPYRVLILDRDSMSGDLLVNALASDKKCQASTIQPVELLRALATGEVDLVVIGADVQTGTGNGYDLSQTISRRYPALSIVILLHKTTQESVINAFRSGARGVFSRHQSMTEFFDCVEHVRSGYIWAGRQETDTLVDAFKSIPTFTLISTSDSPALSARELQVVHCAARGKTNRAIANELHLSEHTVKNYLFRAFEKLGVSSRVELLFYLNLRGNSFNSSREEDLGMELGIAQGVGRV